MFGAGDVRVVDAPDPTIEQPTDAVLRVAAACVCGSDLHPFHTMPVRERGSSMGHEMIGVVEEIGADVRTVRPGDVVIVPFVWSCGECDFCREGLQTSCRFGRQRTGGAQAQYRRTPLADGTLYRLDVDEDDERMPGLLTLSDVYGTGYHAALTGGAGPGKTVAVIGDGAVGLLAVLSARELGAERIILMGRHDARTDLGRRYGATDVVAARGAEGIAAVRDLTGGDGAHVVVDAVGHLPAYEQALGIVRDGGAVSRVGVPQYTSGPIGRTQFDRNITITGGVAPVRAHIDRLLPDVLDGTVDPGAVFDREVGLEEIPEAYRLMDAREALKVLVRP